MGRPVSEIVRELLQAWVKGDVALDKAAEILNCSFFDVLRLIEAGQLVAKGNWKNRRVNLRSLADYLASKASEEKGQPARWG